MRPLFMPKHDSIGESLGIRIGIASNQKEKINYRSFCKLASIKLCSLHHVLSSIELNYSVCISTDFVCDESSEHLQEVCVIYLLNQLLFQVKKILPPFVL